MITERQTITISQAAVSRWCVVAAILVVVFFCNIRPAIGQAPALSKGPRDAPVTIVEFADYQCPFCERTFFTLQELMELYQGSIKLEFRHFPLPFHPDAALAHQASLAAEEQGKFWEMHDLLFKNQGKLKRENLISYAVELGLDMARFTAAIDSMKFKTVVEKDLQEGQQLGVNGTPTFFINGKALVGALPLVEFQTMIEQELKRAGVRSPIQDLRTAFSRGPENAPIEMTVYGDFQSPVSAQAAWTLEELLSLYPDKILMVFRHFPLPIHPDAMLSHEAAIAAAKQGKFWEMSDILFQQQEDFSLERILAYGKKLSLDMSKFQQDLDEHRYRPVAQLDLNEGVARGVRGVPAIFINGRRIDGLPGMATLRAIVEEELSRQADGAGKAAIPGERLDKAD